MYCPGPFVVESISTHPPPEKIKKGYDKIGDKIKAKLGIYRGVKEYDGQASLRL